MKHTLKRIDVSVEREAHQNAKLPKDWHPASSLQLLYSKIYEVNRGWERFQLPKSSCSCCPWDKTTHTNLIAFWLWRDIIKSKNSRAARNVLGPRLMQLQTVMQQHQVQTQPLLTNPNIARLSEAFHSKPDYVKKGFTLHITTVVCLLCAQHSQCSGSRKIKFDFI